MTCTNVPTIADWLMVFVTIAYVIATVFIFRANNKSAKAAKQQLEEMKNQFEINDSPSVEVEFHHFGETAIGIRLVNHGKHTAQSVRVYYSPEFLASIEPLEKGFLKPYINSVQGKECVLGVEQHTDLFVADYNEVKEVEEKPPIRGVVKYTYKEKELSTNFYFDLDNYLSAFHVTCHEDEIKRSLDTTSFELHGLNYHEAANAFNPRR